MEKGERAGRPGRGGAPGDRPPLRDLGGAARRRNHPPRSTTGDSPRERGLPTRISRTGCGGDDHWARDVGIDGGASSAEETTVRIVPDTTVRIVPDAAVRIVPDAADDL
ncbi:DUF5709 domain-containing protein [Streptomyces sp. NPDC001599]|uniref:DUF5709 domain-containing protein n=1 Tax=Streptomyces sp. NPDC001599 TaxID=3364591 RepID=UPI0036A487B7